MSGHLNNLLINKMQEIERKFLVKNEDYKLEAAQVHHIVQAYLNRDPQRTVRIRIKNGQAFLTVKGASNNSGTTRFEWETEIPLEDARKLLELAEPGIIEKVRYIVPAGENLFYEVDEFLGDHKGLVLAEIELPAENTPFEKPAWLGEEVTGNQAYYNAQLSKMRK